MAEHFEDSNEFVDWKGRKLQKTHRGGGIKGVVIACVVEVLENMVFLSYATNVVSYFRTSMHYEIAKASNMVTNFMATSFLLTIFGGFISDSFITRFWTLIIFGIIELLGLIILTIQAFRPAVVGKPTNSQEAILYAGVYAMATGVGGVKATLQAHGADQLDKSDKRRISSFFNWYFFSLCTGGLLSCTIMVWIEDNKGWKAIFPVDIAAFSIALCIFASGFLFYRNKRPTGSPLTRIAKVLWSAIKNWKESSTIMNQHCHGRPERKFKFLEKSMGSNEVSPDQVEETRTFLGLLPIFASTIMMNCCLAQLQTFTVHQGATMNRKLTHNFEVPTPSLSVIPLVIMLTSISFYERLATAISRNTPDKYNIFKPLKRVGLGLLLASGAMAVAAVVEDKRRDASEQNVKLSVFWLAWQYLLLGVSDMLTLGGMLEFFYSEAPDSMRSMSTALAWCSTSMGYFLSSVIVTIVNSATRGKGQGWLGGADLDHNRLDLFYTLLCVLNFLNFLNYIYWAKRY